MPSNFASHTDPIRLTLTQHFHHVCSLKIKVDEQFILQQFI